MKPVILLLVAAATIGAAPSRPARPAAPVSRYEAGGFEPFWSLVIEGGWLTYSPNQGDDQPQIRVGVPPRQRVRNGYRYVVSPHLTIDVRHERCASENGQTYADTVTVTGVAESGCGGVAIPPRDLGYSGWTFHYVDHTRLPDSPEVTLGFREGRVTLQGPCHVYEGTYRERRPLLHVDAISESRTACQPSATERRIVQIMRTPMRMSFIDGDTLVLTNRTGSLRLLP